MDETVIYEIKGERAARNNELYSQAIERVPEKYKAAFTRGYTSFQKRKAEASK